MSQSILPSLHKQSKSECHRLISLIKQQKLNQQVRTLLKSIKNNFGIISSIGSKDFHLFTRQTLLHLDNQTCLSLDKTQPQNNTKYLNDNNVNSPRQSSLNKNQSFDTSIIHYQDAKHMLRQDMLEVESQYQISHELAQQDVINNPLFKKVTSTKSYQNSKTQSYDNHFQKQLNQFKQVISQKSKQYLPHNKSQRLIQNNSTIKVYTNKQIGTDKDKKPIQWVYCEVNNKSSIQLAYFISSTIVYQLEIYQKLTKQSNKQSTKQSTKQPTKQPTKQSSKQITKQQTKQVFESQVKKFFEQYKSLQSEMDLYDDSHSSDMPQIVLICPLVQNSSTQSIKSQLLKTLTKLEQLYMRNGRSVPLSPFNQSRLSPIKQKLPPTPKRLPLSHKSLKIQQKVRLQFRIVGQEDIGLGKYSRVKDNNGVGRTIFNMQSVKTIAGNKLLPQCYLAALQTIASLPIKKHSFQMFYQIWEDVFSNFFQDNMQSALNQYEQKITQLTMGRSLVSQSRLQQAHEAAKRQTMRVLSQKKIGQSRIYIASSSLISSQSKLHTSQSKLPPPPSLRTRKISISRKLQQSNKQLSCSQASQPGVQYQQEQLLTMVQSRIQLMKSQIQEKVREDSSNWGRKFLETQYALIERKVTLNQVKTIPMFKHQLQFLRQIYVKKLQANHALQYQLIKQLQLFLFEKVFIGMQIIQNKQRQTNKDNINKETNIILNLQNQIKDMKRAYSIKQRNLNQQKQQIQNKLDQMEHSIDNLNRQFKLKQDQLQLLNQQFQDKQSSLQQKHQIELKNIKQKLQQSVQKCNKLERQIYEISCQLQKQQLLHQQTHQNYQDYTSIKINYQNNIKQLQLKVKQLKQQTKNKQNQDDYKEKYQQQIKIISKQFNNKIKQLEQTLNNRQKQFQQVSKQHLICYQNFQNQYTHIQHQKNQLQLQNKLLQQKLIQIQSRLPRYKANQVNLQKVQKQKQQLTKRVIQICNQKALSQQQHSFTTSQLQASKSKHQQLICKYNKLQLLNQQYYDKLFLNKKQSSIQTDFTIESLDKQLNKKCQNCVNNKDKLRDALYIVDQLNHNYQRLKQTYLAQKTHNNRAINNRKALIH